MDVGYLTGGGLQNLLHAPHSLRWQQIHRVTEIDDVSVAEALSTLTSLTTLDTLDCRSVAFLPALTRLRTLRWYVNCDVRLADDITAGLACCTQLTSLLLHAEELTSQHLSQALSHLHQLRSLTLHYCSVVESLVFLSDCGHLAQTLQSLELRGLWGLHSTLEPILTLRSLTQLSIIAAYGDALQPLTPVMRDALTPPSRVLTKLAQFRYQ